MFENIGGTAKIGAKGLKYADYALKAANGEYGSLSQEVMRDATSSAVKFGAEGIAGKLGLSEVATNLVGKYASNVVGLLLTPLSANAPVSPATQNHNKMLSAIKAQTISALLFKFMRNNEPSHVPSISAMQHPVSDHLEDRTPIPPASNQNPN